MEPTKSNTALNKYRVARSDYRTIAINQLSFANNLLLTLAVGFLTLGIDRKDFETLSFSAHSSFSWSKLSLILMLVFFIISIIGGVFVMFSRLYDFRITRYILSIRIRIQHKYKVDLGYPTLRITTKKDRWESFWVLWRGKEDKFFPANINLYEDDRIKFMKNFMSLRKLAADLGSASMKWTQYQAATFIAGMICFVINLLGL